MKEPVRAALANWLLALADDALLLAHRNAEWTGHAPILEEDIAFANIAQDELGHAMVWYDMVQQLTGQEPNALAFHRSPSEFRNVQLVEYPRGDWAFSMTRQYLYDAAEKCLLERLRHSAYPPLAAAAAKMQPEEMYHLRHTAAWMKRLGLGTAESHRRTQAALTQLWSLALQLFVPLPHEAALVEASMVPAASEWQAAWLALTGPFLQECGLQVPGTAPVVAIDRGQHTQHLAELLQEMQSVARQYPEVIW